MRYFLDTNIFIRFLTGDHPVQSPKCLELMKKLAIGEIEARTSEAVITEICYVLSSPRLPYKLTPEEIRETLSPIISFSGLKLPYKEIYVRALDIYATHKGLDFEDALNAAYTQEEQINYLVSYDKGLDQIAQITRQEP